MRNRVLLLPLFDACDFRRPRTLLSVAMKRKCESHDGSHRASGPTSRLSGQAVAARASQVSSLRFKRLVVTGKLLLTSGRETLREVDAVVVSEAPAGSLVGASAFLGYCASFSLCGFGGALTLLYSNSGVFFSASFVAPAR